MGIKGGATAKKAPGIEPMHVKPSGLIIVRPQPKQAVPKWVVFSAAC
jgi:hypothetical protein